MPAGEVRTWAYDDERRAGRDYKMLVARMGGTVSAWRVMSRDRRRWYVIAIGSIDWLDRMGRKMKGKPAPEPEPGMYDALWRRHAVLMAKAVASGEPAGDKHLGPAGSELDRAGQLHPLDEED